MADRGYTYYESQKENRFLKHTLDFIDARSILDLLDHVIKENCYGCQVDHPSQVQHSCLRMSEAEDLDLYFDKAFDKTQFDDVVTILRKHIEIIDILRDHKNSIRSQLEDWCNENKPEAKHLWLTTEILFSKMYITLSEQFQHSIEKS